MSRFITGILIFTISAGYCFAEQLELSDIIKQAREQQFNQIPVSENNSHNVANDNKTNIEKQSVNESTQNSENTAKD